jgi:U3 small nucleolar RNA-associated protein 25
MEDPNSITTRLLTFLNIDATKAVKRKQLFEQSEQSHKLNKRRAGLQDENAHDTTVGHGPSLESTAEAVDSTENVTSEGMSCFN